MRLCSPSEFKRRWPGSLRPIGFPDPTPAFPDDCQQTLSKLGLPRQIDVRCYNDLTMRFGPRATPLGTVWEADLNRGFKLGEMPISLKRFWHLGEETTTQHHAWLCIEEASGRLFAVSPDWEPSPIVQINSSVASFFTCLAHLLEWSEEYVGSPAETEDLLNDLLGQTCVPADELEPFWLNFIYATLDGDPTNLRISVSRNA